MTENVSSIGEPLVAGRPWLQVHGEIVWRDVQEWAEGATLPGLRSLYGANDTVYVQPQLERLQKRVEANFDLLRELGVAVVATEVKIQPVISYDYKTRQQKGIHEGLRMVSERLKGPDLVSIMARTPEEYAAGHEITCHIVDGLHRYLDNREASGQPFLYDIFKPNQFMFRDRGGIKNSELPLLVDVEPAFAESVPQSIEAAREQLDEFSFIVQDVLDNSFVHQRR